MSFTDNLVLGDGMLVTRFDAGGWGNLCLVWLLVGLLSKWVAGIQIIVGCGFVDVE